MNISKKSEALLIVVKLVLSGLIGVKFDRDKDLFKNIQICEWTIWELPGSGDETNLMVV